MLIHERSTTRARKQNKSARAKTIDTPGELSNGKRTVGHPKFGDQLIFSSRRSAIAISYASAPLAHPA
jgi:hypothetical protein